MTVREEHCRKGEHTIKTENMWEAKRAGITVSNPNIPNMVQDEYLQPLQKQLERLVLPETEHTDTPFTHITL